MDWNTLYYFLASVAFCTGITWWLARQFSALRQLIYDSSEKVLSKLEYHERHDDQRFSELRNDIWEIRLRNAAIDGQKLLGETAQPRERL